MQLKRVTYGIGSAFHSTRCLKEIANCTNNLRVADPLKHSFYVDDFSVVRTPSQKHVNRWKTYKQNFSFSGMSSEMGLQVTRNYQWSYATPRAPRNNRLTCAFLRRIQSSSFCIHLKIHQHSEEGSQHFRNIFNDY